VIAPGASPGETKMWAAIRENFAIFCTCGSNNWETVEDRWVHAASVWQALNCLSIHATYCVIVAGASPRETKMWAVVRENGDFVTVVNYTFFAAIMDSFMSN